MEQQLSFPTGVMQATAPARREARTRRDLAIQQVGEAADRRNADWCNKACEALRQFARKQAGVWTIELARAQFEKNLPPPSDLRAWGRVTQMAIRKGYIERVPGQFFAAASSNNAAKSVWKKGPKA
ncbi:MAG TPA: hypothetical protein VF453_07665 [Burkholderiaceae bacterium]